MFTGDGAAHFVDSHAGLVFESCDFCLFIGFVGKAPAQDVEVDIAVAGVADATEDDARLRADSFQRLQKVFQLIRRHDEIFHGRYRAFRCRRFRKGLSRLPDLVGIGHEDFHGTEAAAEFISRDAVFIEGIFVLAIELDNHIGAALWTGLLFLEPVLDDGDDVIIHKFQARRRDTGFRQGRDQGKGLCRRREDSQEIGRARRQRHESQRQLGDDAQRPFGTDDDFFQRITGSHLVQALAEMGDFPCRRDDFDGIDLIPRRPIFDGPVAAGIGRPVAADTAAVAAARVAGIEQSPLAGFFLDDSRNDTGFDSHIHGVFIDFQDAVHPFCTDHDAAAAIGNGTAFQARPGPPGNEGDDNVIGQADYGRQFFCRRRQDDDIGQTRLARPFILTVGNPFIPFGPDIFLTGNLLQCRYDFRRYLIILHDTLLSQASCPKINLRYDSWNWRYFRLAKGILCPWISIYSLLMRRIAD